MSNMMQSLYNIRFLDETARKNTVIHRLHPLAKLVTTMVYLVVVVSFDRYEIGRLLPLVFYPVLVLALGEIPVVPVFKRLLAVEPLIIGIGILNPLFDHEGIVLAGMSVSRGWITFLAIFVKCGLTVLAALLLIASTGMDKIALALRMLRVPRLFVLQFLLTYRYISVLMEEVARTLRAYSLRAPKQKGIHRSSWGSLAGQLLLRTFDRAERVYQAMCLRGFHGEYHTGNAKRLGIRDLLYTAGWISYFVMVRLNDIPAWIELFITGVVK